MLAIRPFRAVFPALILLAVPACGGRGMSTAEVEGTILWQQKPLKSVQVQFLPDLEQRTRGPRSTAVTDDRGHYVLYFDDDEPGAVVGHHRVLLLETDENVEREPRGAARRSDLKARSSPKTAIRLRVLDRYKQAATTPLKTEVRPGKQTIDFNLP